jgi:hypothetical protein
VTKQQKRRPQGRTTAGYPEALSETIFPDANGVIIVEAQEVDLILDKDFQVNAKKKR